MEKPLITSLSNPLIKQARALRQKKVRSESGLFLVEGIHHVGEVIEAGWDVESILYAPELLTSSFASNLLSRLSFKPQPVSAQRWNLWLTKKTRKASSQSFTKSRRNSPREAPNLPELRLL